MSPEIYRLLHVVGVLFLFLGLGGSFAVSGKEGRGLWMALHGIGLLVMVVAGVGVVHKAPLEWAGWLYAKIACWVVVAAVPFLVKSGVLPRFVGLLLALAVGGAAVWLAQTKPF